MKQIQKKPAHMRNMDKNLVAKLILERKWVSKTD
jgi:hypothetical protein